MHGPTALRDDAHRRLCQGRGPFTWAIPRAWGLRLAVDDAGAGYASLKRVVELEPDIVKVDRSLVDGVASDRARRQRLPKG